MRSVGVTGTNGKTTTTTWLAAALEAAHSPVFRATTLGYSVGGEPLPFREGWDGFLETAQLARARGASVAAVELTSQALWGGAAQAWPLEVGVFTQLSHDHLDAHGDAEHYLASKAQLFLSLPAGGCAVLNGCDPAFELLREVVPSHTSILTYGHPGRGTTDRELDLFVTRTDVTWSGTTMTVKGPKLGAHTLEVRGLGDVFAENAAAALLGAFAMGVPFDVALRAVTACAPPKGRFEVVATRPHVVVDYAHTPDALARTCATARHLAREMRGQVWLVFGAGGGRDCGKRRPMGEAARSVDHVVLTADNPRDEDPHAIASAIGEGLNGHAHVELELDRERAIRYAVTHARPQDLVLVCGKGHETEQVIAGQTRQASDRDTARAAQRERDSRSE